VFCDAPISKRSWKFRVMRKLWGTMETVAQLWDLGRRADAMAGYAMLSSVQYLRTAHPRGLRPVREGGKNALDIQACCARPPAPGCG
jgi:hypothetical protein